MIFDLRKLRRAYHGQKILAKQRDIPFLLTFEEWLGIWIKSGHLAERGRKRGQYVMSRFADEGCYKVGNVRIQKGEDDLQEGHKTNPLRKRGLLKINKTRKGKTNLIWKGRKHSPASIEKMRLARLRYYGKII